MAQAGAGPPYFTGYSCPICGEEVISGPAPELEGLPNGHYILTLDLFPVLTRAQYYEQFPGPHVWVFGYLMVDTRSPSLGYTMVEILGFCSRECFNAWQQMKHCGA